METEGNGAVTLRTTVLCSGVRTDMLCAFKTSHRLLLQGETMARQLVRYFLLSICALVLGAAPARSEQAALQGVYAIDNDASDNIKDAIERDTANMNFAIRPLARSRIAQTNPRYERITLSSNATTVSVQFDASKPIEMPLDGRVVPSVDEDGKTYEVSAQLSATQLVMRIKSKDGGERVNTFVFEPNGKALKLSVRLLSTALPTPVSYALAYRRQAG